MLNLINPCCYHLNNVAWCFRAGILVAIFKVKVAYPKGLSAATCSETLQSHRILYCCKIIIVSKHTNSNYGLHAQKIAISLSMLFPTL